MRTGRSGSTISAAGATGVGLASLIGGVSGYLVLLVATRVLDPERNADFLTFWSLLFWCFGVLGGLQNETTRAVRSGTEHGRGARVLPLGLGIGAVAALAVVATGVLWAPRLLGEQWPLLVAVLAVALVAFAGHATLCGALAGGSAWGGYSALVASEALVRVLLVGAAAVIGAAVASADGRAVWLEAATGLAAGTWLALVLVDRRAKAAARSTADVPARRLLGQVGHAVVAAAASAALVVGFTVLLRATTGAAEFASAAPVILAISVTRAPLLIPLTAYQGVAIAYFLDRRGAGLRAVATVLGAIGLTTALASIAAGLVGPWLMRTVFGPAYGVPGPLLAMLTAAAGALALVTLTGAAVLATGDHRWYATGWVVATVVAVAALLLPMDLEPRAVVALSAGPLAGAAIHGAALRRRRPTDR